MFYFYSLWLYICLLSSYSLNLIFNFRSVAPGFIIGQLIIFVFSHKIVFKKFNNRTFLYYFFAISFAAFLSLIGELYNYERALNSLVFMVTAALVCLNTAYLSSFAVENEKAFNRFIIFIWKITSLIGVGSLLFFDKYIVFFGEPSFFVLFYGALTLAYSCVAKKTLIPCALLILFGVGLPNATVFLFIPCLLAVHYQFKVVFFPIILILLAVIFGGEYLGEYYSSRVQFTAEEANLSSLMFAINWLDIWNSLINFQIIGNGVGGKAEQIISDHVLTTALIDQYGNSFGLESGTFLFARIIQSLGIFGGLYVLYFVYTSFSAYMCCRFHKSFKNQIALSMLLGVTPDLFFRTTGLLSFSFFLILFSFMYFKKVQKYSLTAPAIKMTNSNTSIHQ